MIKRVFVFIVSLAALVSIGLMQCAGSVPNADTVLSGLDADAAVPTSCLHD